MKGRAFETWGTPFSNGLATVTEAVPGWANRPAPTVAINCVLDTKVVLSGAPFHCTIDAWTKPVPVSERVNAGSPTYALLFERLRSVGGYMVSVTAFDTAFDWESARSTTRICAVPGCAIRLAGTNTVIWVAVTLKTAVGGRGV